MDSFRRCGAGARAGSWSSTLLSFTWKAYIVVPMALFAETNFQWPLLVGMTVWPLTALTLTLTILPRAKAVFIAAIWAMKAPGFE